VVGVVGQLGHVLDVLPSSLFPIVKEQKVAARTDNMTKNSNAEAAPHVP